MIHNEDLLYYGHPHNRAPLSLYQRNNSFNGFPHGLITSQYLRSNENLAIKTYRSYSTSPPPSPTDSTPRSTGSSSSSSSLRSLTVYLVTPLPVPMWTNPSLSDIYEKVFLYVDNDPRLCSSFMGSQVETSAGPLFTPAVTTNSPVHEVLNRLLNAGFAVKQFDRNEVLVECDINAEPREVRCAIWTLVNHKFNLDAIDFFESNYDTLSNGTPSPSYTGPPTPTYVDEDNWGSGIFSLPPLARGPAPHRVSLPVAISKPNINHRRMSLGSSSKRMGEPIAGESARKRFVRWFRRITAGCLNKKSRSNSERGNLIECREY